MSFAEIANRRLLSSVASHLGALTWDVQPDGDQAIPLPPSADVDAILRQLSRCGLVPAYTAMLLDRFESRPLERALIAYDIAAGSLLGPDDAALTARVRTELAPLGQLGATATVAVPRDRIEALIAAAAAAGDRPMAQPSLASIAALAPANSIGIAAALELADRLGRAHLPSYALAIHQILWTKLALPEALDQIVELVLDFERYDSLPMMPEQDDHSIRRQAYFGMRVCLLRLDTGGAANVLEAMSKFPAVANSTDPKLFVAKTEMDLSDDEMIGFDRHDKLDEIAPGDSTWRYGARVRAAAKIQQRPDDAPIWVDLFLTSFGNDMRVWSAAGYRNAAREELLQQASREIRYCSHDPEAWRALTAFAEGDATDIEIELQARSAAQLAAALA